MATHVFSVCAEDRGSRHGSFCSQNTPKVVISKGPFCVCLLVKLSHQIWVFNLRITTIYYSKSKNIIQEGVC